MKVYVVLHDWGNDHYDHGEDVFVSAHTTEAGALAAAEAKAQASFDEFKQYNPQREIEMARYKNYFTLKYVAGSESYGVDEHELGD